MYSFSLNQSRSSQYLTSSFFFFLQKKARLVLLEQERSKAREETLQEEARKISEALEESDKLRSEVITHRDLTTWNTEHIWSMPNAKVSGISLEYLCWLTGLMSDTPAKENVFNLICKYLDMNTDL